MTNKSKRAKTLPETITPWISPFKARPDEQELFWGYIRGRYTTNANADKVVLLQAPAGFDLPPFGYDINSDDRYYFSKGEDSCAGDIIGWCRYAMLSYEGE